jgi:hypothetical protein
VWVPRQIQLDDIPTHKVIWLKVVAPAKLLHPIIESDCKERGRLAPHPATGPQNFIQSVEVLKQPETQAINYLNKNDVRSIP